MGDLRSRSKKRSIHNRLAAGRRAAHSSACGAFQSEGRYWLIRYEGHSVRLPDGKGLRYLALLLASPHVRFAANDLPGRVEQREQPLCSDDLERARSAVTKRIKNAIRQIAACHPGLGYHLSTAIRTGRYCTYQPDPGRTWEWDVDNTNED